MPRRKKTDSNGDAQSPQEAVDAAVKVLTEGDGDDVAWIDDAMGGFLNGLFTDAIDLRAERADVIARQGGNRDAVRALKASGRLTPAQVALVDALYPVVVRGTKEEAPPAA